MPIAVDPNGCLVRFQVCIGGGEFGWTETSLWTDVNGDHKLVEKDDIREVLKSFAEPPDQMVEVPAAELVGKFVSFSWRVLRRYNSDGIWRVRVLVTQGGQELDGSPGQLKGAYGEGKNFRDGWIGRWLQGGAS